MNFLYTPRPSNGARELARALGIRRLRENGTRQIRTTDTIINWGCASALPVRFRNGKIVNTPAAIAQVSNKLTFFNIMNKVKIGDRKICPKHFTTRDDAVAYLRRNGGTMVCRRVLNGSAGAGIVVAEHEQQVVEAPLYTRYIPKQDEYRIHILGDQVIDKQRKARRLENDTTDWKIRNLANGFVFVRENVNPPKCVIDVAKKCMENLDLDFGAVDVVYNAQNNRAYVLEVNSAPGLEGTTVVNYANAFRRYLV